MYVVYFTAQKMHILSKIMTCDKNVKIVGFGRAVGFKAVSW